MTIGEYIDQLTEISSQAQHRLSRMSLDNRYLAIPVAALEQLYTKYRNINFAVPDSPFELVALTFGFVELEILRRRQELYFASLGDSDSWHATVQLFREEAERLESAVRDDFDRAFTRSQ